MSERIEITTDEDGLRAVASVVAGPEAGRREIEAALDKAGVSRGLLDGRIEDLANALADPEFATRDWVLARGQPAQPGRDAALELCIDPGIRAASVDDTGRIDYRARGLITRVVAGQRLARIVTAVPGQPGARVDGDVIEVKPPRTTRVSVGDGATLAAGEVVAARSGAALYRSDPHFDVVDLFEHRGDVDLRSGDLEMSGSVVVSGDVARGFIVRASGDVEIKGSVASGMVISGADARISGGVTAGSIGRVVARGSLFAHHAQGAILECGGDLYVEGDIVGGQAIGRTVSVKGKARSADVRAEDAIEVGEAGRRGGSQLVLAAAQPLMPSPHEVARASLAAARIRRRSRARVGNRIGAARARPRGARAQRDQVPLQRADTAKLVAMRRRQYQLAAGATVDIRGTAYPGVVVKIGTLVRVIETPTRAIRLRADLEHRCVCQEALP